MLPVTVRGMKDISRTSPQRLGTVAHQLFQQACPSKQDEEFFNRNIQRAMSLGMNWEEGLQFVISQRQRLN